MLERRRRFGLHSLGGGELEDFRDQLARWRCPYPWRAVDARRSGWRFRRLSYLRVYHVNTVRVVIDVRRLTVK